ncbi:alkaline phosphatase [Geomicrobium sp. JCM 19038]|uniref:alkaline phosphatase n=1 Tax=Geomicrobium sp. JCM 19038 TaxID=1460635 RepID=UPI00045F2C4B|nr:alkaline phosphatase [Geomicrobium sp. JCM 19038]GAK07943.1 alkaline phosphatase [Geomicrobium sp. JCM 19038]
MRFSLIKAVASLAFIVSSIIGLSFFQTDDQETETVDNIILMIGDGMGTDQLTAASYTLGDGSSYGELAVDQFPSIGLVRTHSNDHLVTDSAAAGTALATGYKTDNGIIGKTPTEEGNYEEVSSIFTEAKSNGKATGMVTTARLTHATPAAFTAHIDRRKSEEDIAPQLLDDETDVLFGGGRTYFDDRDDNRDLLAEANQLGYEFIEDVDDLQRIDGTNKVLGLFHDSHLSFELDREDTKEPSLELMTEVAIEKLSKTNDGFFLVVEGGRIDHAGHDNSPADMIQETLAFDRAVQVAYDFAEQDENTLIVVTADHSTGGMALGYDDDYHFYPEVIQNVTRSVDTLEDYIKKEKMDVQEVLEEYAGIEDVTEDEVERVEQADTMHKEIATLISERAAIGWTTHAHEAANVPLYSYGPGASQFATTQDNTEIPAKMRELLQLQSEKRDE